MATQTETSPHLASARQLLQEVAAAEDSDPRLKATAAVAHATLVLAEQVAGVRLVMAAQKVNGHAAAAPSS